MNETRIQWKAREHEHRAHDANWFWTVGVVALGFSIVAAMFGNALLGVLIIIATIALFLQAVKKPSLVTFTLDDAGVMVGRTRYRYEDLDSFALTEQSILIKSKRALMPFLTIPLPAAHRDAAYDVLAAYLPERAHVEPAADTIMEKLGF